MRVTNSTDKQTETSEEPEVRTKSGTHTESAAPKTPAGFRGAFGRAWRETWTGLGDFLGTALPFVLLVIAVLILLSLLPKG